MGEKCKQPNLIRAALLTLFHRQWGSAANTFLIATGAALLTLFPHRHWARRPRFLIAR